MSRAVEAIRVTSGLVSKGLMFIFLMFKAKYDPRRIARPAIKPRIPERDLVKRRAAKNSGGRRRNKLLVIELLVIALDMFDF